MTEGLSDAERRCVERYLALVAVELGNELEEVVLFGSAARGDMWPAGSAIRSDIDLLVVTTAPLAAEVERRLLDATYPLFLECGRQLGPQFRTREQLTEPRDEAAAAFAASVEEDGVVLWRRGSARAAPT